MEHVDKIIILSIREVGYEIEEDIRSLAELSVGQIIEMVILCVRLIQPVTDLPTVLPAAMSARFNLCSKIAQHISNLGYKGEVGYHTFLYFNELEIRRILVYLIEKLPKSMPRREANTLKNISRGIRHNVETYMKSLNLNNSNHKEGVCGKIFSSVPLETGTLLPGQKLDCKPIEWRDFVRNDLPFIVDQTSHHSSFLPSIISHNATGVAYPLQNKCSQRSYIGGDNKLSLKGTALDRKILNNPIQPPAVPTSDEGNSQNINENSIDEIVEEDDSAEDKLNRIKREIKDLESDLKEAKKGNKMLRMAYEEKLHKSPMRASLELLPNADVNVTKLKEFNRNSSAKMEKFQQQWAMHKSVLLEKLANLESSDGGVCKSKRRLLLDKLTGNRTEFYAIVKKMKERAAAVQKIKASGNDLDVLRRTDYTKRILEIIHNIRKQHVEIEKILSDNLSVQKELNGVTGKITRAFDCTEQLIAKNTKNNKFSRQSYKLLITLNKDFSDVFNIVAETGTWLKEIKELEQQLSDCSSNDVKSETIKQLIEDLTRIKEEIWVLEAQVGMQRN